ncbi:MAG: nucleoside kinase [Bacilli bacterium]|nr:hypothetical protein [Bacillales bacterium]MDY2575140.1 nucleoside kinase [Bacilli bacterium]
MSNTFKISINGKTKEYTGKVKIIDLIEGDPHEYIIATVNNRLRELTYEVYYDAEVVLYTVKDYLAIKPYETSLRYIIAMACSRAFPNHKIKFSYNISRSIYISLLENKKPFTSEEFKLLKKTMDDIIKADYPITRKIMTNEEAESFYKEKGFEDKIGILKYRPEKTVHFNECDGYLNYMYGQMVPSTGHIKYYRLRQFGNGIIVQYPRSEEKGNIPPFEDAPVYGSTLKESYNWSKMVKCDSIAAINRHVENEGAIDFINLCEQHHNNMLADLGKQIKQNSDSIRLICIAGPSSSGKTTFANRLRIELLSIGIKTIRISIDDYYLEKKDIPLDENGNVDLECLEALDVALFNENMLDLINGQEVTLPHFDFQKGCRVPGRTIKLDPDEIIIIEGIHALNEKLTSLIAKHQKFKIFIAPQAQINLDNHNPISLTDLRLLRRIVRDYQFRNASAEETMEMWPSVRKGEFKWIYKTQENANYVFNSLLPYELCVMKTFALPLLKKIDYNSPHYILANRLVKFLKYFVDLDTKWIPCNSILREFVGGSCFDV